MNNDERLAAHRRLHNLNIPTHPEVINRQARIDEATLELQAALGYVDGIRTREMCEVTYETMQRSGFRRKNSVRKYTLRDARQDADTAAIRLRKAWELLDPITPHKTTGIMRLALSNSQTSLQVAIGHLHAILNSRRSATEMLEVEREARDWLKSIGSDPTT